MEFGNTYIFLFGYKIFEPITILTNLIIFLVSLYCFKKLRTLQNKYAKQTALFIILTGISTCFASVCHGMQHQSGVILFRFILFISHAFSLMAFYFCFNAAYTYIQLNKTPNKYILYTVLSITFILMIFALINGSFLFIKIPAGVVLIYSLIVHYLGYRKNIKGSRLFIIGILVGFLSIIVHSLRISFSDWFNHKDIAHIIIATSLIFMCTSVKINSKNSNSESLAE